MSTQLLSTQSVVPKRYSLSVIGTSLLQAVQIVSTITVQETKLTPKAKTPMIDNYTSVRADRGRAVVYPVVVVYPECCPKKIQPIRGWDITAPSSANCIYPFRPQQWGPDPGGGLITFIKDTIAFTASQTYLRP